MDFLKSSSQPLSLPVDLQTPPDSLNSLIILSRYVVSLYKESGGVWSFAPDSSNPDSKYKGAFGKQARYAKSSRVAGASKKNVIQKNALANPSPSVCLLTSRLLQTPPDSLNSLIILSRYVVSLYKESGGVWSFAPDSSNPDSKYKGAFGKQARYAKSSRVAGASKKNDFFEFLSSCWCIEKKTALKTGSGTAHAGFEDLSGRCVAEWKVKPAKQAEIQVEVDENDFFENDFPDYPRRVSIRAPALADKSGGVWRYDQFTCNINMLGELL
jgi:hypothetical protein